VPKFEPLHDLAHAVQYTDHLVTASSTY